MSACLPTSMEPMVSDAADGVGSVDRRGRDGFGRSHLHAAAGQCDGKLHGLIPGRAGVAICRQRREIPSASMILRAGVKSHSASPNGVQGNETATVSDLPNAAISALEVLTK